MTPALFSLIRFEQAALLFLRVGLGLLVAYHGYPFFLGGPPVWTEIGQTVRTIGIPSLFTAFGLCAALTLFFGGLFVVVGFFTRLASLGIGLVLLVAAWSQFRGPDGFEACTHALGLAVAFLALFILGPGRFSLDEKLFG